MEDIEEIARRIRNAESWDSVQAEIEALCKAAELEGEWLCADGESFEDIVELAADRLGVFIY